MNIEEENSLNDGSKYTNPKNFNDTCYSIAMKLYLTKIGHLMFDIIHKILWVIEKTVIWISPCKKGYIIYNNLYFTNYYYLLCIGMRSYTILLLISEII